VLRFEAIVHNTKELRCGQVLDRFGQIVARLAAMTERFCTMLDCVDIGSEFRKRLIGREIPHVWYQTNRIAGPVKPRPGL
jgi:hypothetical protein